MHYHSDSSMQYDAVRLVSVLAYLTVVGWLIAALLYGRQKSPLIRFHLRQSLGLILTAAVLVFIPLIGWLLTSVVIVAWCISVFYAGIGQKNILPLVGDFYQIHLDFIK